MKRFLPLLIVTSIYSQWFSVAGCNNNGDLDGNGELEIGDIAAIQNLILEAGYSEIADANTDGKLSVTDLVHALNWFENDSYPCFQRFIYDNDTLEANVSRIVLQDMNGNYLFNHDNGWGEDLIKIDNKGYPIDTIFIDDSLHILSIVEDEGVGYVIAGELNPVSGYSEIFISGIDYDGSQLWFHDYPWEWANNLHLRDLIKCVDGGYAVIGRRDSMLVTTGGFDHDVFFLKLDSSGNGEWYYNYDIEVGGSNILDPSTIVQRPDSGFVIVAKSTNINEKCVFMNVDKNGNFEDYSWLFDDDGWEDYTLQLINGIYYSDSNYYLYVGLNGSYYVLKLDIDFDYLSYIELGEHGGSIAFENNSFAYTGWAINQQFLGNDYLFKRFTLDGQLVNYSTLELYEDQNGEAICPTNDGGYFISIKGFGYVKTDSTGQAPIWLLYD